MPYIRLFECGAITFTLVCLPANTLTFFFFFKWSANMCLTLMWELVFGACTKMWNAFGWFCVWHTLHMFTPVLNMRTMQQNGNLLVKMCELPKLFFFFFQWSTADVQNATRFRHGSGSVSELQPSACCLYLRRSSSVCSTACLLRTCCLSEQWVNILYTH